MKWERFNDNCAAWCAVAPEWELCMWPAIADREYRQHYAWRGPFRVEVIKHDGAEEQNILEQYKVKRTYKTAALARAGVYRLWRKHYEGMTLEEKGN